MQIFWLSPWHYGRKHLVKMPLEAGQCGYCVWHNLCGKDAEWCRLDNDDPPPEAGKRGLKGLGGMGQSHKHHPIVKWMQQSGANYLKAIEFAFDILQVYRLQYARRNKSPPKMLAHLEWLYNNIPPALRLTTDALFLTVPPCLAGKDNTFQPDTWSQLYQGYQDLYASDAKRDIALELGNMPTREQFVSIDGITYDEFMLRRKVAPWIH
ncbi:MAG: hypothetical protein CMP20_10430 [Rickettsiales bacterium]|nr:hypothetical protein [Rickettsiales bacterium]